VGDTQRIIIPSPPVGAMDHNAKSTRDTVHRLWRMVSERAQLEPGATALARVERALDWLAADVFTWRTKKGTLLAPTTTRNYLLAARTGFQLAFPTATVPATLAARQRRAKKEIAAWGEDRAVPMTVAEYRSIRRSRKRNTRPARMALQLMWAGGLRYADVRKITPSDIQPLGSGIRVCIRGRKGNKKGAYVWLQAGPQRRSLAAWLLTKAGPQRVSTALRVETPILEGLTRGRLVAVLRLVTGNAALTAHSARRGAATYLADRGVAMTRIRDFLGHDDVATTRIYVEPRWGQPESVRMRRLTDRLTQ
jgi:integrase